MKKTILYTILFLIILNFTLADHTLSYDNFMEVNVTETISLIESEEANETMSFLMQGNYYIMNQTSDLIHTISVLSTKEEDVNAVIFVQNASAIILNQTYGDQTRESEEIIINNSYFAVSYQHVKNHTQGQIESVVMCPLIRSSRGDPEVHFYMIFNNSGTLIFKNSQAIAVTNTNYENVCYSDSYIYEFNTTEPPKEFFGMYCSNCGPVNRINIGVDTTTQQNNSYTFLNQTEPPVLQSNNYMGNILIAEGSLNERYDVNLKFRIPYYVNITLFDEFNKTLNSEFDYIYLKDVDTTTSLEQQGIALSNTFNTLINILTLGTYNTAPTIDTSEVFWSKVNNQNANIKMYEKGNYSINLLSVKTYKENGWQYEFIKPQYSSTQVETKLDARLNLDTEDNVNVKVYVSEYESNKKGFILNYIKWGFVLILSIVMIVIGLKTGSFYVLGAMMVILSFIIKLLGLI